MWHNIGSTCLPQEHQKMFSNGLPDFSGLTKEEFTNNCKLILESLPTITEQSMSDKAMFNSFLEKLYTNFAKYICNICKSNLDKKIPNPETKVRFALNKIKELQEKVGNPSQIGAESMENHMRDICVEYHCPIILDDMYYESNMYQNGDASNTQKNACFSDDHSKLKNTPPISQSSPKKEKSEISFFFSGYIPMSAAEDINPSNKMDCVSGDSATMKCDKLNQFTNKALHVRQSSAIDVQNLPTVSERMEDVHEMSYDSSSSGGSICFENTSDSSTSHEGTLGGQSALAGGSIIMLGKGKHLFNDSSNKSETEKLHSKVKSNTVDALNVSAVSIDMADMTDISFESSASGGTICFENISDSSISNDSTLGHRAALLGGSIIILENSKNLFEDSSDESETEESDSNVRQSNAVDPQNLSAASIDLEDMNEISFASSSSGGTICFENKSDSNESMHAHTAALLGGSIVILGKSKQLLDSSDKSEADESYSNVKSIPVDAQNLSAASEEMEDIQEISFESSSSGGNICFENKSDSSMSNESTPVCQVGLVGGSIILLGQSKHLFNDNSDKSEADASYSNVKSIAVDAQNLSAASEDMEDIQEISFESSSSGGNICFENKSDSNTTNDNTLGCGAALLGGTIVMLETSKHLFGDNSSDESDSEESYSSWSDNDDRDVDFDDFNFECGGLLLCNLVSAAPANELVEDEFTKLLKEANKKWTEHADKDWVDRTPIKVNFNEVVFINEWDDSLDTRKSPWVEEGINRMRFHKRIEETNSDIGWIFDKAHREKIFNSK